MAKHSNPKGELEKRLSEVGNDKICPTAIIVRDGKFLIGLRNYTTDKWKDVSVWTAPGGRCDNGEKIENTLRREVEEETGISDLDISEFIGEVDGAKEGDIVYLFLAGTNQEAKNIEPEKFSGWKWTTVADVPKNFINPKALELIKEKVLTPPGAGERAGKAH